MVEKTTPSRIVFNILNYTFMVLFSLICIIPLWHVLMASISNPRLLMSSSGIITAPLGEPTLDGYRMVLANQSILTGYGNTLFYVVATSVIMCLGSLVGGFLLSRRDFKLKGPLTIFFMITMMFGGGMIPSYMVVKGVGLLNTVGAAILPGCLNAFYIMMMKSSFDQLSPAYEESAKIDGANPVTIMFRILAPMLKASIAVIIMFNVIYQWNSWFNASIYLPKKRNLWPLSLFMREILINNDTSKIASALDAEKAADYTKYLVKHCVTIVGTLPLLLAYPFAQKYFVTGVQLGGIKG